MFPGNVNFQKTDTKHDLDIRDVVPCLLLKIVLLKYRNSNSKNFKHSVKNKCGFPPLVSFSTAFWIVVSQLSLSSLFSLLMK